MDVLDTTTRIATNPATIATALAAFSTVHTFLDKHPRTKALMKVLAHTAGPLNLPAMWRGYVELSKEVVKADEELEAPMKAPEAELHEADWNPDLPKTTTAAEDMATLGAQVLLSAHAPPPLPAAGTVKEWPK